MELAVRTTVWLSPHDTSEMWCSLEGEGRGWEGRKEGMGGEGRRGEGRGEEGRGEEGRGGERRRGEGREGEGPLRISGEVIQEYRQQHSVSAAV